MEASIVVSMSGKTGAWKGTLALMVLKTLERKGSLHGYGIARHIEQASADLLSVNTELFILADDGYSCSLFEP
jgi:hypothetical protein